MSPDVQRELASELRRRQLSNPQAMAVLREGGLSVAQAVELVNRLSDQDIIDAYRTCSCCGELSISDEALAGVASVDEFFALLDAAG